MTGERRDGELYQPLVCRVLCDIANVAVRVANSYYD